MTRLRTIVGTMFTLSLLAGSAGVGVASDGVLEINQTCAAGAGCFPGDEPGYPVRIAASGSYVLTSDLSVSGIDTAITTQLADASFPANINVAIDLNGFTIEGPTTCSGTPLVCSLTSADPTVDSGIVILATDRANGHVHSGTIQGLASVGVICSGPCVISDLIVSQNGLGGVSGEGTFRDIHAVRNGSLGIALQNYGTVESCVARENGGDGFFGGGVFVKNLAALNEGYGISGNPGSVLENNLIEQNENGVRCRSCVANHNSIRSNTVAGIDFESSTAAYGSNLFQSNGSSVANAGAAVQTTPNACPAASPCP